LGMGANEVGASRPLFDFGPAAGARGVSRPRSALPKCEARFELLYRAELRALFRLSWAVPIWESRATKQPVLMKSVVRWELLSSAGLPNTP
jgi:hypothetical protein